MRTLFFSLVSVILVFSSSGFAVEAPKKAECVVYKIKALVKKKNKELVLIVAPGSRSQTLITMSSASALKVMPLIDKFGIFTVKLSSPLKKFSNNSGEVLSAQIGILKAHESSLGTAISCIE